MASKQGGASPRDEAQARTVKALADKLQAGWAMLANTCPQCNTPLVREKGGRRIFCVSCELWVVRESDLSDEQKAQVAVQEARDREARLKAASEKPSAAAPAQSSAAAVQQPRQQKSIEELEAGLASLRDHRLYDHYHTELHDELNGPSVAEERKTTASSEGDDGASGASVQRHMARLDDLSARLGAKMMQGWTLLGDHCPNERCNCPLMQPRGADKTSLQCVNCGATVRKDGDSLRIVATGDKQSAAAVSAAPATATSASSRPTPLASLRSSGPRKTRRQREEDFSDEDDATAAAVDDDEERLRRAEAEEAADVVPSPSALGPSRTVSGAGIGAGEWDADLSDPYRMDGLPADLSDEALTGRKTRAGSTAAARPAATAVAPAVPSSEEVSARLGAKMLAGYALLAQSCPRSSCSCPLVRKRDGPMLCVSCGSEMQADAQGQPILPSSSGAEEADDAEVVRMSTPPPAEEHEEGPSAPSPSRRQSAFLGSAGGVSAVKRMASPGLNALREESLSEGKRARGELTTASPQARSPLMLTTREESNPPSGASSGLPSPSHATSRSRTWSMETEDRSEAAIDPRLRAQAQLGGKSGRFGNAPHSRAPSLALGVAPARGKHTSSAALNAAAQVAFARHTLQPHSLSVHATRSIPNSLEASPSLLPAGTPPQTPIVPSLALPGMQQMGGLVPSGLRAPAPSRSTSVNLGSLAYPSQQLQPPAGVYAAMQLQQAAAHSRTGSLLNSPLARWTSGDSASLQPLPLPSPALDDSGHSAGGTPAVSSAGGAHHSPASASAPVLGLASHSILDATLATLLDKVEETRARLASCHSADGAACRDMAHTLRELVITIDTIQRAREQQL